LRNNFILFYSEDNECACECYADRKAFISIQTEESPVSHSDKSTFLQQKNKIFPNSFPHIYIYIYIYIILIRIAVPLSESTIKAEWHSRYYYLARTAIIACNNTVIIMSSSLSSTSVSRVSLNSVLIIVVITASVRIEWRVARRYFGSLKGALNRAFPMRDIPTRKVADSKRIERGLALNS
jgi:hypothetical protein